MSTSERLRNNSWWHAVGISNRFAPLAVCHETIESSYSHVCVLKGIKMCVMYVCPCTVVGGAAARVFRMSQTVPLVVIRFKMSF